MAYAAALSAYRRGVSTFYVWPEHEPAFRLFCSLGTVWFEDFGERVGLRWADVRAHPAVHAIRGRKRREQALADLAVIERAWLCKARELKQEAKT